MSQVIRAKLADNVKKFRELKGYTREELSIMLGFDNSYISKLERKSLNITIDRVAIIAKALGVEVYQLLE